MQVHPSLWIPLDTTTEIAVGLGSLGVNSLPFSICSQGFSHKGMQVHPLLWITLDPTTDRCGFWGALG